MKVINKIIARCYPGSLAKDGCPYSELSGDRTVCKHPEIRVLGQGLEKIVESGDYKIPDWCPLEDKVEHVIDLWSGRCGLCKHWKGNPNEVVMATCGLRGVMTSSTSYCEPD